MSLGAGEEVRKKRSSSGEAFVWKRSYACTTDLTSKRVFFYKRLKGNRVLRFAQSALGRDMLSRENHAPDWQRNSVLRVRADHSVPKSLIYARAAIQIFPFWHACQRTAFSSEWLWGILHGRRSPSG
jgi:hypothetical protein